MAETLVSTITACYRMKRYLQGFLERLPQQSYFDRMEVVLDHNEPTREELNWVREFQARYPGRLKHILVEDVDPIGLSWNRCIREASGQYLTIWNVDDLRTDDSIQQQVRLLEHNPGLDFAYGNYRVVRSFGSTQGELVDVSQVPEAELTRSMILGPFFMFRKSICAKAGAFDEQFQSGLDFDLAIRLAIHGHGGTTSGELGYYLNEGLGASTRPNSLQPIERTAIELRYGIYDKLDYSYVARASRYNTPHLLQEGRWVPVERFVPNYEAFLEERRRRWLRPGLSSFSRRWRRENGLAAAAAKRGRSLVKTVLHAGATG